MEWLDKIRDQSIEFSDLDGNFPRYVFYSRVEFPTTPDLHCFVINLAWRVKKNW